MPYEIRRDDGKGIVEIVYSGAVTAEILRAATAEAIALQKRTGALGFLIDTGGGGVAASITDVYDLPDKTYPQEEVDRRTRIALIRPNTEAARQAVHFFEDACRNRGWNARVFEDRAVAIDWLMTR